MQCWSFKPRPRPIKSLRLLQRCEEEDFHNKLKLREEGMKVGVCIFCNQKFALPVPFIQNNPFQIPTAKSAMSIIHFYSRIQSTNKQIITHSNSTITHIHIQVSLFNLCQWKWYSTSVSFYFLKSECKNCYGSRGSLSLVHSIPMFQSFANYSPSSPTDPASCQLNH